MIIWWADEVKPSDVVLSTSTTLYSFQLTVNVNGLVFLCWIHFFRKYALLHIHTHHLLPASYESNQLASHRLHIRLSVFFLPQLNANKEYKVCCMQGEMTDYTCSHKKSAHMFVHELIIRQLRFTNTHTHPSEQHVHRDTLSTTMANHWSVCEA